MPPRLREPHAISDVLELGPELLVLADYGQIVPSALLDVRLGALNLHPSLLPRHRGATPIPAAILAGDPETGVTLMRMDDGLDTGPIVDRTVVPLEGRETAPDLEAVLASVAADLLRRALPSWLAGQQATPQADDGATMTRPLRREDGRLQPHMDAARLERQVRAYQPWPGSFVETPDGRLTIWSAELGGPTDAAPGAVGKTGVAAGDARWLRLVEVQPAGGRRMPWAAYLRGRPSIVGASIVE
jgi:methionyl-tRNA formyltransferase